MMAAPPNVTTRAMSGKFTLNKSLSDSTEEILRLQGVPWFERRAISLFTPILCIKHTTDEAGIEHIDVQTLSGGLPGTLSENRTLDWQERDEDNDLFGFVTGKARRIPVREIADEFLKKDWAEDGVEDGVVLSDYWSTPGKNGHTWKAVQVIAFVFRGGPVLTHKTWGFAVVNGGRRYVRYTTFTSPRRQEGPIQVRFVYDYNGEI